MISASKEKLASYFQGNSQFKVPFFQRAYVWQEDNWSDLWEHVEQVLDGHRAGNRTEHFIGTIIAKRAEDTGRLGEATYEIIDGQQRLTTIALFLKAISDVATSEALGLKDLVNGHLLFCDAHKQQYHRIEPSGHDEKYYSAVMTGDFSNIPDKNHNILAAYEFFKGRLNGRTDEELDQLRLLILDRVPVISMILAPSDDEQEIFDTINALGVRLTTAELLKNFIFKERELRPYYDTHWRNVFESSEEMVEFWAKDKTAGRVIRSNLEVLLYCYLIIKTGAEVRMEKLFKEYKNWFKGTRVEDRLSFLDELRSYADTFAAFPSGTDLNQLSFKEDEKRFFHLVENLNITTVYPLVLFIYRNVSDKQIRCEMLKLLESYLVRRNVCRFTTKNYNQIFIQMVNKLRVCIESGNALTTKTLSGVIRSYDKDTNKMPSDNDLEIAFKNSKLSNQNAREILFVLALKQASGGLSDVNSLSLGNYSVEHMMPVKWRTNWMDFEMNELEMAERDRTLKLLGNLTLVTGRLNSKMQNHSWADKKPILRDHSSLPMTVKYIDLGCWDEAAIEKRGKDLMQLAMEVWPYFTGEAETDV